MTKARAMQRAHTQAKQGGNDKRKTSPGPRQETKARMKQRERKETHVRKLHDKWIWHVAREAEELSEFSAKILEGAVALRGLACP